jgi:hypothetical protein
MPIRVLSVQRGHGMKNLHHTDPAAATAVRLRSRIRALMAGQTEAFDAVYYHFGAGHPVATLAAQPGSRLTFLMALLADLAWVHGDLEAHDGSGVLPALEADAVKRVCWLHTSPRRRYVMGLEQRAAVIAYLDALLVEIAGCAALDEHAPSRTLGREAHQLAADLIAIRAAVAAS